MKGVYGATAKEVDFVNEVMFLAALCYSGNDCGVSLISNH